MLVYFATFVIYMIIGGLLNVIRMHPKTRNILLSIVGLCIYFPIMAFRSLYVGTDTYNYVYNIFLDSNSMDIIDSRFPIYMIFNKIIYMMSQDGSSILIFNALITLSCMTLFYYKLSKNIYVSWIYYFLFTYFILSFNAMRQFMAISMGLLAYAFFVEGKNKKAILLYLMAILSHITVSIGLLLPMISKVKWNLKKLFVVGGTSLLLSMALKPLLIKFSFLFGTYESYLQDGGVFNLFEDDGSGNRLYIGILLFFTVLLAVYFVKIFKLNNDNLWIYTVVMMIAAVITIMFSKESMIIRLIYPLTIFSTIYIPELIETIHMTKMHRFLSYVTVALIMLVPCYLRLKQFIPFTFFWEI